MPYRESKLTRVLGDSLGGSAFTAIILNITPNHGMLDETLSTLAYAKTAQRVENTPKQHVVSRKEPQREEEKGDDSDAEDTASDNGQRASGTSGAVKSERQKWTGRCSTAPQSSMHTGSSAYVRPWEGQVPICTLHPRNNARLHLLQRFVSRPPALSPDIRDGDTGRFEPLHPKFGRLRSHDQDMVTFGGEFAGRKPATRGAVRSSPTRGSGDVSSANYHRRPSNPPIDTTNVKQESIQRFEQQVLDEDPAAMEARAATSDRRSDPFSSRVPNARRLSFSTSEKILAGTGHNRRAQGESSLERGHFRSNGDTTISGGNFPTPKEHRMQREGRSSSSALRTRTPPERVFDSLAAKWVHAVVLETLHNADRNTTNQGGSSGNFNTFCGKKNESPVNSEDHGRHRVQATAATMQTRRKSSAAGWHSEPMSCGPEAGFTIRPKAKEALEEIFSRYEGDRNSRQGFLLPEEVAVLQDIWYCPVAEPPSPPKFSSQRVSETSSILAPKKKSVVSVMGGREPSMNSPSTAGVRPRWGGDSNENCRVQSTGNNDVWGGGGQNKILPKAAFFGFCLQAAARDAIFIRHMFLTCGYDLQLNLTEPPNAAPSAPAAAINGRKRRQGKRGAYDQEVRSRLKSDCGAVGYGSRQPTNSAGGSVRDPLIKTPKAAGGQCPRRKKGRSDEASNEDDAKPAVYSDVMPTGGIVDPADLWDRMEDRANSGDKYRRGGVLSRGGGAHVSVPVRLSISGVHPPSHELGSVTAYASAVGDGKKSARPAAGGADALGKVKLSRLVSENGGTGPVKTTRILGSLPTGASLHCENDDGEIQSHHCNSWNGAESCAPPVKAECGSSDPRSEHHGNTYLLEDRSTSHQTSEIERDIQRKTPSSYRSHAAGISAAKRQGEGDKATDGVIAVESVQRPCEWCGFDVNSAGSVHTPAFCDETFLRC